MRDRRGRRGGLWVVGFIGLMVSGAGCSSGSTGDECGDGQVTGSEECDGTNLVWHSCISEGFAGGTLSCSSSCTVDTSECLDCLPNCTGRECGNDGCGGDCGECTAPDSCDVFGLCGCTPECSCKDCGDDGCGGDCGECTAPDECDTDGQCVCQPDCDGKDCGPDGCGGACGWCFAPDLCYPGGHCQCVPDCEGRECGPDDCWDVCGTCAANQACDAGGQCVCVPDCQDKLCGDDGCQGSCGTCQTYESCDEVGQCVCVPDCTGRECGSDGCGDVCGTCQPGGYCDIAGQCVDFTCIDLASLSGEIELPPCDVLDQANCICEGCTNDGVCFDQDAGLADDCHCPDCANDELCNDPQNCREDGLCNPYAEGCICPDCAMHPLCPGCTPDCTGRQCGSDGCGGSCGLCPVTERCNDNHQCVGLSCIDLTSISDTISSAPCDVLDQETCACEGCIDDGVCFNESTGAIDDCVCPDCASDFDCQLPFNCINDGVCNPYAENCDCTDCLLHPECTCFPDCSGKECGDDSCSGSCGTCLSDEACEAGQCVPCTPDCTGRECGWNGCSGSCGDCQPGLFCDAAGQCMVPVLPCVDLATLANLSYPPCDVLDQFNCICEGCLDDGECESAGFTDDCICPDCASNSFCTNPNNCTDDGLCDPFNEGCVCTDCAQHPFCP